MPSLKARIDRIEKTLGESSGLHLAVVVVQGGEDREAALARTLKTDGLDLERVAAVVYFETERGIICEDLKPVRDRREIIGLAAFWDTWYEVIKSSPANRLSAAVGYRAEHGEWPEYEPTNALSRALEALCKTRKLYLS